MNREYHRWYSPSLGRDMELLLFGHAGARVVVYPTSQGRFFEWEDRGMVAALGEQIANGWIQLYCLDSVDSESWYARWKHPGSRAWRQMEYEHYVRTEVLPFTQHRNANPFLMTTGASFGAYHAVNFAFRHPWLVGRVIGMSGLYNIKELTGGYSDETVYQNDPSHYILNEHDPPRLDALRHMDIILAVGETDPHVEDNRHLSRALWEKGIGNALRIWDGWAHDWPWWREMVGHYVGGHD